MAPELELRGPSTKIFRVPKCTGLSGRGPALCTVNWQHELQHMAQHSPEEFCRENPLIPGRGTEDITVRVRESASTQRCVSVLYFCMAHSTPSHLQSTRMRPYMCVPLALIPPVAGLAPWAEVRRGAGPDP